MRYYDSAGQPIGADGLVVEYGSEAERQDAIKEWKENERRRQNEYNHMMNEQGMKYDRQKFVEEKVAKSEFYALTPEERAMNGIRNYDDPVNPDPDTINSADPLGVAFGKFYKVLGKAEKDSEAAAEAQRQDTIQRMEELGKLFKGK